MKTLSKCCGAEWRYPVVRQDAGDYVCRECGNFCEITESGTPIVGEIGELSSNPY